MAVEARASPGYSLIQFGRDHRPWKIGTSNTFRDEIADIGLMHQDDEVIFDPINTVVAYDWNIGASVNGVPVRYRERLRIEFNRFGANIVYIGK